MKYITLFFTLSSFVLFGQKQPETLKDSMRLQGILLNQGWKWYAGDDPDFAKVDFDDSEWSSIDPSQDIMYLPQIQDGKIGWLRLKIQVNEMFIYKCGLLNVWQAIASEIYVDGKMIAKYGTLEPFHARAKLVLAKSLVFPISNDSIVLAVRFAFQKGLPHSRFGGQPNPLFFVNLVSIDYFNFFIPKITEGSGYTYAKVTGFVVLFLLHFIFSLVYPTQKTHLYFSGMTLAFAIQHFLWLLFLMSGYELDLEWALYLGLIRVPMLGIGYIFLLRAIYAVLQFNKDFIFWVAFTSTIALILIGYFKYKDGVYILEALTILVNSLAAIYISIKGVYSKKRYATLLFLGIGLSLFGNMARWFPYFGIFPQLRGTPSSFLELIGILGIPLCLSLLLGQDFATTSIKLKQKLEEVEQLSEEKQQLLITQNETLEKQVEERTSQLRASQAQLIQSEKLASLGELTAGIAHEIQNPLNFVNNFAEVSAEMLDEMHEELEKGDTTEAIAIATDLKTNLEKINHHGKRASSIVKGMLEHSQASTGVKEPTNLNALADEYLRLAYHGLRAKDNNFNATMETHFDPNLPKVSVIPQDIGRVLLNLINNAFYAVTEKAKQGIKGYQPTVTISSRKLESTVEIRVEDNGNGIPEAIKDKIFQPFFTTKPTGQGTGLGLSLAYDIVTKGHGGTLKVESEYEVGTAFIIHLPFKTSLYS